MDICSTGVIRILSLCSVFLHGDFNISEKERVIWKSSTDDSGTISHMSSVAVTPLRMKTSLCPLPFLYYMNRLLSFRVLRWFASYLMVLEHSSASELFVRSEKIRNAWVAPPRSSDSAGQRWRLKIWFSQSFKSYSQVQHGLRTSGSSVVASTQLY